VIAIVPIANTSGNPAAIGAPNTISSTIIVSGIPMRSARRRSSDAFTSRSWKSEIMPVTFTSNAEPSSAPRAASLMRSTLDSASKKVCALGLTSTSAE
jgi:hypothetical protein